MKWSIMLESPDAQTLRTYLPVLAPITKRWHAQIDDLTDSNDEMFPPQISLHTHSWTRLLALATRLNVAATISTLDPIKWTVVVWPETRRHNHEIERLLCTLIDRKAELRIADNRHEEPWVKPHVCLSSSDLHELIHLAADLGCSTLEPSRWKDQ